MTATLSIGELTEQLDKASTEFNEYCSSLSEEQFFYQPVEKWSVAQQIKHLVSATNMAALAFRLPKVLVRIVGGKPNRKSRTFDELVAKYELKLQQGGKASSRYVPKPVPPSAGKEKLLKEFSKAMLKLSSALQKNWKEPQPDKYIAPHPLLGKITLRELSYFTIHHTRHHLASIQKMIAKK
ncbi:MAG TPA: DinB family protein [Chitinophagaceae bacterium]|nr:DinB family protein [Chitinophagaceae bacterium]